MIDRVAAMQKKPTKMLSEDVIRKDPEPTRVIVVDANVAIKWTINAAA